MGSKKNNQKKMTKKNVHIPDEKEIEQKIPKNTVKKSIINQEDAMMVLDHIFQGLKINNVQKLNLGEITKEHRVAIFSLYEELAADSRNVGILNRAEKSEIEIADVIVDYIKAKNKPIDLILKEMSKKEIDLINKLIFKKIMLKK